MLTGTAVLCVFCKPESSLVIAFVLVFYALLLIYASKTNNNDVKKTAEEDNDDKMTIRNFQTYFVKKSVVEPSVSVRIQPRGMVDSPKSLPSTVKCTEVYLHRKMFIGRIEWKIASQQYIGFIKECINPIEMSFHRRFEHPNIVTFYWSNSLDEPVIEVEKREEEEEGFRRSTLPISFYCMEFCTQKSLQQFLMNKGHSLGMVKVVMLMHDVVSALNYLHSLHIVHRDIKSENIMVQGSVAQFIAKLADFDHAVQVNDLHHMEYRREQYGTPLYLAPEAILTDYCQPTQYYSHDMYSVGLVIWEMFSWVRCKQNIYNKLAGRETTIVEEVLGDDRNLLINPSEGQETISGTCDVGGYRPLVTCSSTVHIPLLKQICDTLGLTYSKQEGVLRKGGIFFKEGRLIEKSLMFEFYSKDSNVRPCVFREPKSGPRNIAEAVKQVNDVYTQCWGSNPEKRLSAQQVLQHLETAIHLLGVDNIV